jgi:uncharacterized protein (DUF1778 family)
MDKKKYSHSEFMQGKQNALRGDEVASANLRCRVMPSNIEKWKKAAKETDKTLTEFVVEACNEKADKNNVT